MKSTKVNFCVLLSLFCLSGLFFLCFFVFKPKPSKTVFINNITLFNSFNMSKDLGEKHKSEIASVQKSFDSLITVYNIFKEQKNDIKALELEKQLQAKDRQLSQMNDYLTKEVSQQVWNRLNVYIKEYGEAHKLKFILGTQGNGNVMYAEEGLDVTEELLDYVNEKYEGN